MTFKCFIKIYSLILNTNPTANIDDWALKSMQYAREGATDP